MMAKVEKQMDFHYSKGNSIQVAANLNDRLLQHHAKLISGEPLLVNRARCSTATSTAYSYTMSFASYSHGIHNMSV